MFSIHGLLRAKNPELGRDADTGGQIVYVLEMARALAARKDVEKVYIFTRLIDAPNISDDYKKSVEKVSDNCEIIRIPFGPKRYLRKESLWPYIPTFIDNCIAYFRKHKISPDLLHGHYADAGLASKRLSACLGGLHVFTGHSLGRVKMQGLVDHGLLFEEIEKRYKITTRIEAEEIALDHAAMVIASTENEKEQQYALYDHYNRGCMRVVSPGVNLERFSSACVIKKHSAIWRELKRFLKEPSKPMILALCRPDFKKNTKALVRIFGKSKRLQERANLLLFLGSRDDIGSLAKNPREVLKEVLLEIDRFDLYGKVAYPKKHQSEDVPQIYRLAANQRGVFVHPALEENFGLTLLEAASCGLPVIATKVGGPSEILQRCQNGLLINPENEDEIEKAIFDALSSPEQWKFWSRNGIKKVYQNYSWQAHANNYIREVKKELRLQNSMTHKNAFSKKLSSCDRLLLCDIDNTLTGNRAALKELLKKIEEADCSLAFGIATGRNMGLIEEVLEEWKIPRPNVLISSVGSEIYYGFAEKKDQDWLNWLNYRWNAEKVKEVLKDRKELSLQPQDCQNPFKVSYYLDEDAKLEPADLHKILRKKGLSCNLIFSHQSLLDVLPIRCSKGLALRYFANKWGLPLQRVLAAGDSGNDISMLEGETLGVVVANYSSELEILKGREDIYFAPGAYAQGVIDGIEHYQFLTSLQRA